MKNRIFGLIWLIASMACAQTTPLTRNNSTGQINLGYNVASGTTITWQSGSTANFGGQTNIPGTGVLALANGSSVTADGKTLTPAEVGAIDGASSNFQTQINGKQGTLTNSAGLATAISDETGTGVVVFGTSPSISSPTLTGPVTAESIGIGDSFIEFTGTDINIAGNPVNITGLDQINITAGGSGNVVIGDGSNGDTIMLLGAAELPATTFSGNITLGSGIVVNNATLLDLRVANAAAVTATTDNTKLLSDGKIGVDVDSIGEYTRITGPVIGGSALVEVGETAVTVSGNVALPATTSIDGVTPSSYVLSVLDAADAPSFRTAIELGNVDNTSDETKKSLPAKFTTLSYGSGTVAVNFALGGLQTVTLAGDASFSLSAVTGAVVTLRVVGGGTAHAVAWDSGVKWMTDMPTSVPAGKILIVGFSAWGTADSDIVASATEEP